MRSLISQIESIFWQWLSLGIIILPSFIKIQIYRKVFGYQIGKNVKIGFSWINVDKLELGDSVIIRHFNRFKNIPEVIIGDYAIIGAANTFTATAEFTKAEAIAYRGNKPRLIVGPHSAITMSHYFDVQDNISIGNFTTIAGKGSVFFTHYIDIKNNAQSCKPIEIGNYCMVGSSVNFAPGARIPNYCVVGMGSVVTKAFNETHFLIAGNPASAIRQLSEDAQYFKRRRGWVGYFTTLPYRNNFLGKDEINHQT